MGKWKRFLAGFFLILGLAFLLPASPVYAAGDNTDGGDSGGGGRYEERDPYSDNENGKQVLKWSTNNKKITSGVGWRTKYYVLTIDRVQESNNDIRPKDYDHITFKTDNIEDLDHYDKEEGKWMVYSTYSVKYSTFVNKMKAKGWDDVIESGRYMYFHHVTESFDRKDGSVLKTELDTLQKWKNAHTWTDPSTFIKSYNRRFKFEPDDITLSYTYMERPKSMLELDNADSWTSTKYLLKRTENIKTVQGGSRYSVDTVMPDKTFTKGGIEYVLSGVFLRYRNGEKRYTGRWKSFIVYNMGKVASDKNAMATVSVDRRNNKFNKVYDLNEKLTYKQVMYAITHSKFTLLLDDCDITFLYVKKEDIDAKVKVITWKQVWQNGGYTIDKVNVENFNDVSTSKPFSYTADTSLSGDSRSVYGLTKIVATESGKTWTGGDYGGTKELNSGKTVVKTESGGTTCFKGDSKWSTLANSIRKVKYNVPSEGLDINVLYAARVPVKYVYYTYDGSKYKLVKTKNVQSNFSPGKSVNGSVDNLVSESSKKYYLVQAYVTSGDLKGVFGATSDSFTSSTPPSAGSGVIERTYEEAIAGKKPEVRHPTGTAGEKPVIIVGIFSDKENPPDIPEGGGGEPETPPEDPPSPPGASYDETISYIDFYLPTDSTTNPAFRGYIKADKYKSKQFNVEQGIPTNEYTYVGSTANRYITEGRYVQHNGVGTYPIKVFANYHCTWVEMVQTPGANGQSGAVVPVQKQATYQVEETYDIKRYVTYYTFEYLNTWSPKQITIGNYCLPDPARQEVVDATPGTNTGENAYAEYSSSGSVPEGHYRHATVQSNLVDLGTIQVAGPTPPAPAWYGIADSQVGQMQGQNDDAVFYAGDGSSRVLMRSGFVTGSAAYPAFPPTAPSVPEVTFYRDNLWIDTGKTNGVYKSTGSIVYTMDFSTRGDSGEKTYVMGVNDVIIHSPVTCDVDVPNSKYCQLLEPEMDHSQLVLDTQFSIYFNPEGQHLNIPGYGWNNYDKYTAKREVKFTFDVYSADGKKFYPGNKWITIEPGTTTFFLPHWVDEGFYTAKFRARANNADANDNDGLGKQQDYANTDRSKYTAVQTVPVQISGRLYGLQLFDISDYPNWKNVFRIGNTDKRSGFYYSVGINNQNGAYNGKSNKHTFALVNGSHPYIKSLGTIKTGYAVRYKFETVGNLDDSQDYLQIKPKFYYVSKDGKVRKQVDLYYEETINGLKRKLVKVGSDLDKTNKHAMSIGDSKLAVDSNELRDTAKLLGQSTESFKKYRRNIWTYGNIMLAPTLRTFVGDTHSSFLGKTNTKTKIECPKFVSKQVYARRIQHWYGEYWLPSAVHAAPVGTDVAGYAKRYGITYKENFWMRDGYIVVNFDTTTINDGKRELSYYRGKLCNMWQTEGFFANKTDYKGNKFVFEDGDFVLYQLKGSGGWNDGSAGGGDYDGSGTH